MLRRKWVEVLDNPHVEGTYWMRLKRTARPGPNGRYHWSDVDHVACERPKTGVIL